MSTSSETITTEELSNAQVLTAREIGFVHDTSSRVIEDSENTLLAQYIKDYGQYVKFILAQNQNTRQASLGIFYSSQSAATAALALLNMLNGGRDRSLILALSSDQISYGASKPPKTLNGFTLIGGGQIGKDQSQDRPSTMTLQTQFGLGSLSFEHMDIVRELVFKKLGI